MPTFIVAVAMMEVEACRVLPGQMVQTISVDVGDAAAVEKAMREAVAKQGAVQVWRGRFGEAQKKCKAACGHVVVPYRVCVVSSRHMAALGIMPTHHSRPC